MTNSPKMSAREIYHAVRRASATRRADYRGQYQVSRNAHSVAQFSKHFVGQFPRGCGPTVKAAVAAVVARQAAANAGPGATLATRLAAHVAGKVRAEAARRRLPTAVDLARAGSPEVGYRGETRVDGFRVVLLRAEGRADYGNSYGHNPVKALSILGGWDDGGMWAVRVPGTITDVHAALDWLMPADVKAARAAGRQVLRQGDVWIVERARDKAAQAALPANHHWDDAARVVRHPEHAAVAVPFPAAFIAQHTLAAHGVGRTNGD
jgi:hypothetical protein